MNEITALDITTTTIGDEDDSATHAIVQAVANAKGISPVDLSPPLYSAVDTDALDKFVDSISDKPASVEISFGYSGFDVTVSGDGSVSLDEKRQE